MSMLSHFFDFKPEVLALDEKAMELCQPYFKHMEEIRDYNQLKMLKAFAACGIPAAPSWSRSLPR